MNGKGDLQRPRQISAAEWDQNWALAFPTKESSCGPGTTTEIGTLNPSGSTNGGLVPIHEYVEARMNALNA